jgi:hypothetical protein
MAKRMLSSHSKRTGGGGFTPKGKLTLAELCDRYFLKKPFGFATIKTVERKTAHRATNQADWPGGFLGVHWGNSVLKSSFAHQI